MQQMRRLLQERVHQLLEEGAQVASDVFVKRLVSSGICKGSRLWHSDVTVAKVSEAAGHAAVRHGTASGPLEIFVSTQDSLAGDAGGAAASMSHLNETMEQYQALSKGSSDIQELSVGYPGLSLEYWLSRL
eukprot:gnl/TRDRNA2_/TRDRNA2_163734_c3_seq2.p1 gnl/TRDRNA2_/TRDRNA2_163734_c3~~gnl/TRDRNA2_/TRDRNA2_163734_c3_seq2.p1  ORF type:complete len:131 (+),score=27.27 gnl/TRDRNA2_/TRDRNA2_163734_c3_seq2:126-518(+)